MNEEAFISYSQSLNVGKGKERRGDCIVKKQLNIFMLTLLILGQTILGPLGAGVANAEEGMPPNDPSEVNVPADSNEQPEVTQPAEKPFETPEDNEEPVIPIAPDNDDDSIGEAEGVGDKDVNNPDNVGEPGEEKIDDDEKEEVADDENELPVDPDYVVDTLNATLGFTNLIVNGHTITDATTAGNVTPKIGDKIDLNYSFSITADKDYAVGSSFQFELPQALLNFDSASLSGTLTDPDTGFSAEYTTSGSTVTVTTTEQLDEANAFTGKLHFVAHFSADGTDGSLDQELVIPIVGGASVVIPFTFQPNTTGQSMSKTGTASIENGERVINWEVWTNRKGESLSNATLGDTLGGADHGLELDSDITVDQYVVGLSGQADTATKTTTAPNFPVSLEDGRFAYKLTYKTKVTREPTKETETFTNVATLTNGSNTDSATASATHTYGTKLDKTATTKDKYNAKWEIKYNYFGSKMASQTLTDTITGSHKIKESSIVVYEVTLDESGNGTKGNPLLSQPDPNIANDGKSFTIELKSPNGEPYLIEYETELDSEYVTEGETISNEALYEDNKDGDSFWAGESIFSKTRGSIDQVNKEITWTITVNAEKAMNNFVIEDNFTSYTEGGTRQKLVNPQDPFTISNGVNPTETSLKGDNGDAGFILEFGNVTNSFTITYKTKYDILPNGTAYPEYKNTAKGSWTGAVDGKEYSITKSAEYKTGNTPTGNNGYKNGKFDHEKQVFEWNLAVNINKQDINGAELVDVIGEGHELVIGTIKVHQLNLGMNDEQGTPGAELESGHTISENPEKDGFTIKFTEPTTEAYIITYQTKDSDDIIGHENGNSYGNTATFTTPNSGSFTLPASTTVKHANELIDKKAVTNPADETITWTVDVNKSHSALGDIILTDKMSANQLILPDKFKMREIKMDKDGNLSYGSWNSVTPTINSENNSFTLDLGNLDQKGYQIEYKTFFLGGEGDTFSNEASINYTGGTAGVESDSGVKDKVFNFNDSSGTIISTKGKLELHKIGLNPLTGESKNLDGITFELWNKSGTIKLQEATTENGGRLTFDEVRYGKYLLKESGTPVEYIPFPASGKEITMGIFTDFNVNGNELFVVENIENVDMSNACAEYTLTIKDVDRNPVVNTKVILTNNVTGITHTATTNGNGEITLLPADVKAGKYTVTIDDRGTEVTFGDVTVMYDGDCKGEVVPTPSCSEFTITIEDTNNIARPDVTVTLVHKDDDTVKITATTDENGKFTLSSSVTKTGDYKVYEGKQYLGDLSITYKNNPCAATVTEAPTCETFTLAVNDVDGKPREAGVEITIKDKDGNVIESGLMTDADGKITTTEKLPAGEYDVYEGTSADPFDEFAVNIDCESEVQPAPVCTDFTLTVKDENEQVRPNVSVTVKDKSGKSIKTATTDGNGKITIPSKDLPAGKYNVFEGELLIGEIDVSYLVKCETEVKGAPTCTDFTLTVQDRNGNGRSGVDITVKDASGKAIEDASGNTVFTTDTDGKVELPKKAIQPGTYNVYEGANFINSFTVTDRCDAVVAPRQSGGGGGTPPPATCTDFMITVYENGNKAGAGKEVTLKSGDKEIVMGKTDTNGSITTPKNQLPNGEYVVYVDGEKVGKVVVTNTCQDTITLPTKQVCEDFKLTVKENGKTVAAGKEVVLKSGDTEITTGKTDANGKITFVKSQLPNGSYDAYVDGKKAGVVIVDNTCETVLELKKSPVDGTDPEEPDNPGTPGKPEDPSNPNEPGTPGKPEDPSNPSQPGTPGNPEDPSNPGEPGTPGKPDDSNNASKPSTPGNSGNLNKPDNTKKPSDIGSANISDKKEVAKVAGGNNLPQTGEAYPIVSLAAGFVLILAGFWMMRRKRHA